MAWPAIKQEVTNQDDEWRHQYGNGADGGKYCNAAEGGESTYDTSTTWTGCVIRAEQT